MEPAPHPPMHDLPAEAAPQAPQRVIKIRRDYNSWVARETMEDYALRYAPQRFRRWSPSRVAHTAFGAASFLILEAVGATLLVQYGFINAFWAILVTGLIIFVAGLPISVYAARHGVDMDLLTRGAGFGYLGSTITSLIYASFTFIFFALEAAVMAYALELALDIPPAWGYLVCSLVVIPLVTHGVSAISRLQLWTQPVWLIMLVVPYLFVITHDPGAFAGLTHYAGESGDAGQFQWQLFGAALTVGVALMTQMGEQADYLRFMPAQTDANRWRWWAAVLAGGPGWVVLGVAKMLGGAALAYLAITHMVPPERAVDPNQMYLAAYEYVFPSYVWAVAATAVFVVVSQLKINVTNAYAGSLAWSNFFSRLTHSHPGRVVWVVFNTLIAFVLMEMDVFQALGRVLGLYSNIAIAWMMAVVADLVINKPLGLSPRGIEFKRAHLYDINPVGVGAMGLASVLSMAAYLGLFGPMAQAFSAVVALVTAMLTSPLLAWATRGRYYIARTSPELDEELVPAVDPSPAAQGPQPGPHPEPHSGPHPGSYARLRLHHCVICEREYEGPDMAHCPAYQGPICSLCCTLDARCGDLCKPQAHVSAQWLSVLHRLLPRRAWPVLDNGLGSFILMMSIVTPVLALLFGLIFQQASLDPQVSALQLQAQGSVLLQTFLGLWLLSGVVAWWLVLAQQSRQVAQEESNRQTHLLMREIALHRQTDEALQRARAAAESARRQADAANLAKSRYLSAMSHELRTPLNSILGYAQLMGEDTAVPPHRQQAVQVIRRSGEHLLQLMEGTLDIARIEAGKLTLQTRPLAFEPWVRELVDMFEPQAQAKGLSFDCAVEGQLPAFVRADEKRLRQILINLLGNAVKFTESGSVGLRVRYAREMALLEVYDSGPGLTAQQLETVFEPFSRAVAPGSNVPGAGLGLTMARMLTDLMGGELAVSSTPGAGSVFRLRLFLPEVSVMPGSARDESAALPGASLARTRRGYAGPRRRVLIVDNEETDRDLLVQLLAPMGFELHTAASGEQALALVAQGLQPDAVLMDLAMPGIDGWETIRLLRAAQADSAQDLAEAAARDLGAVVAPAAAVAAVAVVSANAFERSADNPAGLALTDFIVKPVRHVELIDWLERRLRLQWLPAGSNLMDTPARLLTATETTATGAAATETNVAVTTFDTSQGSEPVSGPLPPLAQLSALLEAVRLGYFRGVLHQLEQMDTPDAPWSDFVRRMRTQAQAYQFDAMQRALQQALAREAT